MPPELIPVNLNNTYRIVRAALPDTDLADDILTQPGDSGLLAETVRQTTNPEIDVVRRCFEIPAHPSRFSDGTFGVWYAAESPDIALAETIYHFQNLPPDEAGRTDFQMLTGSFNSELHDVHDVPNVRHPTDYTVAQQLGATLRNDEDSNGVIWDSVRHQGGGRCIGLFKPEVVGEPISGDYYSYFWDGTSVASVRNETTGEELEIAGAQSIAIIR